MLKQRCQTEVAHLDAHIRVQEEVTELQISMNDSAPMQVLQRDDEIIQVEQSLCL
jgi:hypothetical protein